MATADAQSLIADELENVQDIYAEQFKELSKDPPKCQIVISPNNDTFDEDDANKTTYVGLIVTISFPKHLQYPSQPPLISFEPTDAMKRTLQSFYHTYKENKEMLQLTKSQKQSLQRALNGFYKERENETTGMLFELIVVIQEWVDEHNHPPTNDNFDLHQQHNNHACNQDAEEKTQASESTDKKPKILMLHAYKQNPKIFRARCKHFVNLLADKLELFYPVAPIKLSSTDQITYCWYQYPKVAQNGTSDDTQHNDAEATTQTNLSGLLEKYTVVEVIGFMDLLRHLFKYLVDHCLQDNEPFVGIVSFSQGSTLATILTWLSTLSDQQFEEFVILPNLQIANKNGLYGLYGQYGNVFGKYLKLKGVVLMSGHLYPLPKCIEAYHEFVRCFEGDGDEEEKTKSKEKRTKHKWEKLKCKSLHTMSAKDEWVSMDKTEALLTLFESTETIQHANGHAVYDNKYVAEWLVKCCLDR